MDTSALPSDVISLVRKVAKNTQNMNHFEIASVEANQKGEGFTGSIYMVTLLDKSSDTKLNILIKKALHNDSIRDIVPLGDIYKNEIYFYTNIYPSLQVFRRNDNVSVTNFDDVVPKCLDVCLEDKKEALVFENLKCQGFKVPSKKMYFDSDHVELLFKRYSSFHAIAFAFKHKNPDDFAKITSPIKGICEHIFSTEFHQVYLTKLFDDANNLWVIAEQDDEEIIIRKEFQKYLQKPYEIIRECLRYDDKYAVLLHGDCWSNNMLFKYENETGKPIDLKLIDWQLVNVGNPVCDLSFALYSAAPKLVYDNFDYYLRIYHHNFSLTLNQFGLDADQLYPFGVLKEHWKRHCKFGIFMAVMAVRMKATEADDVLDFVDTTDADAFSNVKYNREEFVGRVKDLFRHLHVVERE